MAILGAALAIAYKKHQEKKEREAREAEERRIGEAKEKERARLAKELAEAQETDRKTKEQQTAGGLDFSSAYTDNPYNSSIMPDPKLTDNPLDSSTRKKRI